MKFGYGGWRAETGEFVLKAFDTPARYSKTGFLEQVTRTLQVEFEIVRDTQAQITSRFAAIANAIRVNGKDVGFYEDSGARSAIFIDSSQTLSGVRITQFPSIQYKDEADYCTHLKGSCAFSADYLFEPGGGGGGGSQQQRTVSYRESVSVRGNGGPRYAWDVTDRDRPRRFTLCDFTPVSATQSGSMEVVVEQPVYPSPNPPLWPRLMVNEGEVQNKGMEQIDGGGFRCQIAWSYEFQGGSAMRGEPFVR